MTTDEILASARRAAVFGKPVIEMKTGISVDTQGRVYVDVAEVIAALENAHRNRLDDERRYPELIKSE